MYTNMKDPYDGALLRSRGHFEAVEAERQCGQWAVVSRNHRLCLLKKTKKSHLITSYLLNILSYFIEKDSRD